MNEVFGNLSAFKFIIFDEVSEEKQREIIAEMNLVTDHNFIDVLRTNTLEKTKIVSVRENGNVVTQAIIFNSTLAKTTVFYLRGRFDPDRIREISQTNQFENLSNKLINGSRSNSNIAICKASSNISLFWIRSLLSKNL